MYQSHQEIFNQDESLKKSLDYVLTRQNDLSEFFSATDYDEILFVACGSSYWLSLSALETFSEKFGIRCSAVTSGDVLMNPAQYIKRYSKPLIIAPSRSGNTSETLKAVDFLKKIYQGRVLGIVEYENAKLNQHSDLLLEIPWANETSVCQTRSFSNLYLVCIAIAAVVKDDQNLISDITDYLFSFPALSEYTEQFIKNLFSDHGNLPGLITLGNGKLFGLICEGAYITVEMAQAPAHFFYTLEFRHGPIVLLDESYLVVLSSDGSQNELEQNLIADIKAKGAKVLVIAADYNLSNADFILSLNKKYSTEIIGLYVSFVTQAIAYYKALILEVNPDKPKDLVPWIAI